MLEAYFDSTNLKAEASKANIRQLCSEADFYRMAAVCVMPAYVKLAKSCLYASKVKICTVIGFPLGAHLSQVKILEGKKALDDGAGELDWVLNIGWIKDRNWIQLEAELLAVLELKRHYDFILKVIVETALLTEAELIKIIIFLGDMKVDYIKTSTGYASRGVNWADIETIMTYKDPALKVKASGGIKDLDFALALVQAGVNRIGTSNAADIMRQHEISRSTGF